jgi:hypothetical protein
VNTNGSNDDEMPSLSLAEWDALIAQTSRELLERLDRWKDDDARREAFLLARIRAGRQLNETSRLC